MAQILKADLKIKRSTFRAIREWKKNFFPGWKNLEEETQLLALLFLILGIAKAEGYKVPIIKHDSFYGHRIDKKKRHIIFLDKEHPSIISTLHECGHMIHGKSELAACRYSIRLFRTVFPTTYKKLKVEGHLLKKA